MPNKVLCWLVGYEMQYYFYINGLFSNAFSADGRQINHNETAVLGESLITVPLCPPTIPFYTLRSRPVLRADRPPVCWIVLTTDSLHTVYLHVVATSKVGRAQCLLRRSHIAIGMSHISLLSDFLKPLSY